ncbi:MAG: TetR/AcrR family transcriptional regulator [Actinobacteria bacterium]|nr:TetR/AcrR family transcriptional regulator [Actinomycetota bacterium]MBU2688838.1 TetR/AcrR family transcriptional regulator [Actinomycetota bacterium]
MPQMRAGMKENGARRSRDPEGTRRDILEAATKLFAEKGVAESSIRDIARLSGQNTGMIYYYFEDKQDLFMAVMMEALMGTLGEVLAEEVNTRGDDSARLRRLLARYLELVDTNPDQALIMMRGLLRLVDREPTPFAGLMADRMRVVEDIVRDGQSSGEFTKTDPAFFSYLFLGIMLMYFFANLTAENHPQTGLKPVSRQEVMKTFENVVLPGLRGTAG